jgi:hypothetical protein
MASDGVGCVCCVLCAVCTRGGAFDEGREGNVIGRVPTMVPTHWIPMLSDCWYSEQ